MPGKAGRPRTSKSKSGLKKQVEQVEEEEEESEQELQQSRNSRKSASRTSTSQPLRRTSREISELKKMIKDLQKQVSKPPSRKLSALNKFKKYVFNKNITDLAIAETDYIDLIPVDKLRLLNKTYPIVWEKLVLTPIYQKYNCTTEEEKEKIKSKKNIQLDYNLQVDSIIEQSKEGELDDQEHFRDDLVAIFIEALNEAAQEFGGDDEEEEEEAEEGEEGTTEE